MTIEGSEIPASTPYTYRGRPSVQDTLYNALPANPWTSIPSCDFGYEYDEVQPGWDALAKGATHII
jgi:hypothetical protein